MYLTRIKLDLTRQETMKALASPNLFHGAIENAEKEGRTRKLWRVDTLGGQQYLLVLSEQQLDFSGVVKQFGNGERAESKQYDGFLERITNGSRWQFRLKANPVVCLKKELNKRGKPVAHITPAHQETWLRNQAAKHGFIPEEGRFLVTSSQWYAFKKGTTGHKVRMLAVTYEGILTVTDAEQFRNALTQGIGREKAYGLGMLTVAGIR